MTTLKPALQLPCPRESAPHPMQAIRALWTSGGLAPAALDRLELSGGEPALPTSFAVGTALQASLGAAAAAAAEWGVLAGGPEQAVAVDMADAVCEGSCRFLLDGRKPRVWDPLSGLYRCSGGVARQVRIHANFAHHRDGVLQLLGLPPNAETPREAVESALARWDAFEFEAAADALGLVVAAVRTPQEWQAHPQSAAVGLLPTVAIDRIADSAPRRVSRGDAGFAPLDGLRVLDLTRILAGPVAGRTLAAYGADVLLVNGPHLPNIDAIADLSRGKRSALVDLRDPAGVERLRTLVRGADVVLQGYRPGALAARGFAPDDLARLRPGIVSVSLSAYGHRGPWAGKRGFDSLVQSATGINMAEAEAFGDPLPRALPLQALDIGAGFLLAFGALAALIRQRREGGSWQVRVSLAGVGHWLESLGRIEEGPGAAWPDVNAAMEAVQSGFGTLHSVRHAARFSVTPAAWRRPSMPPGSHAPAWG